MSAFNNAQDFLPVIEHSELRFHSDSIEMPVQLFSEEADYKFGVLDIKIRPGIPINSKHIHILFNIDCSGSMSDQCSDGRTKMEHIVYTLKNMIRIFYKESNCNISVHIQKFDGDVAQVVSGLNNIRDRPLEALLKEIDDSIVPNGCTNIEKALETASFELASYYALNPDHEIVHVLLTDGEITNGSQNYEHLLSLVPKGCTNIFLGYGLEHDSDLLSHLACNKGNEYRFIDALEKAGFVYGEVIHGLLYKAIEDITLTSGTAEFYDFRTNKWHNSIQVGNLLSEQKKTFHVRSKTPTPGLCSVSVYGKTIVKTRETQVIDIYENQCDVSTSTFAEPVNLGIYVFRQRTQELLYEAKHLSTERRQIVPVLDSMRPFEDELSPLPSLNNMRNVQKNLKEKLNEFHQKMIAYVRDNNLQNDPIMRMLCDDIYIAYKTIGTSVGTMYTTARQSSNGNQHTYMCSATQPMFRRERQRSFNANFNFGVPKKRMANASPDANTVVLNFEALELNTRETLDIENYTPSDAFMSPFQSSSVVDVMREVSGL